ncbi:sn-1-specific diacylglycerol lipase ABHD11-like isoform X2 [Parasteatoda tepidariorum]|uniref:sn-1-specific diacylglycerol lipase ABHD11-like isoform X2 n=2 Tax=Parasteatoda tepidariorum TaxID=114398 RepID=UPI001C721714|nr:protein ABHD11-like isoform X2 [Parasteatoda tepidariorum]
MKLNSLFGKMRSFQILFCLVLLLEICWCNPIQPKKSKKELQLSYSCMRVVEGGKNAEKAPIILLHGLGMFKEAWMGLYQIFALKTGRRVCAVDLRNHGDSPWSDETDTASMASDLNPLMKTLKVDKVILLGHSLGGKVAVHFTLTNPNKVEKLIVEDMRPNGATDDANKMVLGALKIFRGAIDSVPKGSTEPEAKKAVYEFLKKTLGISFHLDQRAIDFLPIKCKKGKCEWKMNLKLFEKLSNVDTAKILVKSSGLFENPALFIYGEASPFRIPDVKDEIEKLFPKAKLFGVKGAGHVVNGFPEYRDEVIRFINEEN